MAFDLNNFISQGLIYGGARTSKFDVQLTLPPALTSVDSGGLAAKKLNFTCKASAIPTFRVGLVQIPYFGRKIKSAGDRVWEDWHITVMMDEDYSTRALFEAWNNAINRLESNVMQASLDGEAYKAMWTITHYSKDGSPIRVYEIINGWPSTVGPIALDWDGTDRIAQFDVTVPMDNFAPTSGGENVWKKSSTITYFGQIGTVG
jgi:hypothetical protein